MPNLKRVLRKSVNFTFRFTVGVFVASSFSSPCRAYESPFRYAHILKNIEDIEKARDIRSIVLILAAALAFKAENG